MRPTKPAPEDPDDLFRARLSQQIDPRHPLVRLAGLIDWEGFEARFGQLYHLQLEVPIDPSSLVRWRRRIGQDGIELLLQETIAAAQRSEAVKAQSLERVSVDTTVQPKAIAHPLDSRLYHRGREILVRLAKRYGVPLRQSYARLGKKALRLASRYAHARQMQRARREIKRLKTYLGRVFRDVRRKLEARPELTERFARAGGGVHRQGQGAQEVRVRRQGLGRRHQSRRSGGRHAEPRRQPVRWPDPGAGACPGRTPHRGRARALLRRPRLSRPWGERRHRGLRRRPAARDHPHDPA